MNCSTWCSGVSPVPLTVERVPAATGEGLLPSSPCSGASGEPRVAKAPKIAQAHESNTSAALCQGASSSAGQQGGAVSAEPEVARGERRILCRTGAVERVLPLSVNKLKGGQPNCLRTTQFTPLTWLPKSLFNQFKRIANVYFLFIAVIVLFGSFGPYGKFSPKDWRSKIGPFTFVLFWTALKDLFEDVRRRNDDRKENMKVAKKYVEKTRSFTETRWCRVLVGDLLYIPCDVAFPADLLLLNSPTDDTAFISTVMLDGETSLKDRSVPKVFSEMAGSAVDPDAKDPQQACLGFASTFTSNGCQVEMGPPNPVLADVRGLVLVDGDKSKIPIGEANFLPRGCVLRNTPYIFALVVYVGEDTKTRLNATQAKLKFSSMQKALNLCVRLLLVCIFTICIYATIMSELSVFGDDKKKWPWYIMFLRFCIAYYHAVPMSLYVVYEMLKLALGFQMNMDKQMFYEGEGAVARTADQMEELGQVDFIFSDKTGTLTANEMVFARGHVDGQDLGEFRRLGSAEPQGLANTKAILAKQDAKSEMVAWFFTCLAVCHEVVLELTAPGASVDRGVSYSGMSPDEVALVSAARDAGLVFERRNRMAGGVNELEVRDHLGKVRKYEVPVLLQFSSDRKRMSVIVRCGGRAWCITKGADSVMEGLIDGGFPEAATEDILKFSKTGLRVLVLAARELQEDFLRDWLMDYQKARGIMDEFKNDRIREVVARIEDKLTFLGLTAVEDRLQDGVPEAIETVKKAGSRVWVLTGDKTETAVNIAYSCALFTDATKLAYCVGMTSVEDARQGLQKARDDVEGVEEAGLVIDGGTLVLALADQECRSLIFSLGMASKSCICTRLSPMQKLQLVQLVRKADPKRITLAIGDGANDVPMILGGHVGVGIRGREGAAAVQVCDIAISQFRFLVPLMLCHGRRSYRRVAVFFCYYLYKNVTLLVADLVWMHWDNFNGRIAFPEYLSIAFNAFFTSWHVLFVLGFDRDVPDEVACRSPDLYKVGPRRQLFNAPIFMKWMLYSLLHGVIAWIVPFGMVGTKNYYVSDFWTSSCCAFTNVVHITLLKMVIFSENPFSWVTLLPTLVAWLMFVGYLWGLGYTGIGNDVQPAMKNIPETMFTRTAGPTLLIAPVAALSIDMVERLVKRYRFPSELQKTEFAIKAAAQQGELEKE